jgi:hypothetical protein
LRTFSPFSFKESKINFWSKTIARPQTGSNQRQAKESTMRTQHASLTSINPCPICGVETALAEIAPHPVHINFEIHGYFCERCGPVKSVVVLCSPPHQLTM